MNKINMHIHTNASDGVWDYKQIVSKCIDLNLKVISITDHDNVDFVKDAIRFSEDKNIVIIPGVELTANYNKGMCHILGYNINVEYINNFVESIKKFRIEKSKKMIDAINKCGYNVSYHEVLKQCSSNIIGRRDIAKVLVRKKYFTNEDIAIDELFSKGKKCYFQTDTKSIEQCVNAIKFSGGISVIAHPWTLNLTIGQLKNFILKYKIEGIEVYNHNISYKEFSELNNLADELNIYKTCGTDFHGQKGLNELIVNEKVNCKKILNKILER